jgi:hypothetical protein
MVNRENTEAKVDHAQHMAAHSDRLTHSRLDFQLPRSIGNRLIGRGQIRSIGSR